MLDLVLAIAHHLLVFGLFGIFFAELILVRPGMDKQAVARIGAIDIWYGVLAGLIIIVGFSRAIFAAKGWFYYSHNSFFWAKLGTFAVIGLLSVPPTIAYIGWRRANILPSDAQVRAAQRFLWIEVVLFALAPDFRRRHGAGIWRDGVSAEAKPPPVTPPPTPPAPQRS
jgi:putative membrane protein